MGILQPLFNQIMETVELVRSRKREEGVPESEIRVTMLSFGYPDLLIPDLEVGDFFPDQEQIQKYHGVDFQIRESYSVFKALGIDLTVVDFKELRNESAFGRFYAWNMNAAPPDILTSVKCDIVLDPGTLEHVFNAPTALCNMNSLVAPHGYMIHWNPVTMINHGFYNFSPTFYYDWYAPERGWELQHWGLFNPENCARISTPEGLKHVGVQRYQLPPESSQWAVAKKIEIISGSQLIVRFPYPIQSKYKEMLNAAV